ncbi:MAG: hypothetical protein KAQ87_00575 [Candidatus Pacebacteria bacterium]|nr:hypothetical protein [Candidatus Paceibacterota bacterium]
MKKTYPIFTGILFTVMVILLFCIAAVLIQTDENKSGRENETEINNLDGSKNEEFASYFDGCDLLNRECLSMDCGQYFLCNDKEYSVCEIYDCGMEFGIGTKDSEGKIKIERKIKDNRKKIMEVKSRCKGLLEVIESNYVDEKFEANIKVTTAGSCKIGGFLVSCKNLETGEDNGFKPAKFSDFGSSSYLISVNNCSEMSEIIAIGENGISIKQ